MGAPAAADASTGHRLRRPEIGGSRCRALPDTDMIGVKLSVAYV